MNGASSCNGTGSSSPACSTPVQGVCPDGWHIPSHYELTKLEQKICSDNGGSDCATQFPYDESTRYWRGTNGEGSDLAGNIPGQSWTTGTLTSDSHFGDSGFDFCASGYRNYGGDYTLRSNATSIWSSTPRNSSSLYMFAHGVQYEHTEVLRYDYDKSYAFPVRCIKD